MDAISTKRYFLIIKPKFSQTFSFKPPIQFRKDPNPPVESLTPYLPIKLYNNSIESPPLEAVLDSGAMGLLIPENHADLLKLPHLGRKSGSGAGGSLDLQETKVGLKIGRGNRIEDLGYIEAVIEMSGNLTDILIGRIPLFSQYKITLELSKKKFTLDPIDQKKKNSLQQKSLKKKQSRPSKFRRASDK